MLAPVGPVVSFHFIYLAAVFVDIPDFISDVLPFFKRGEENRWTKDLKKFV